MSENIQKELMDKTEDFTTLNNIMDYCLTSGFGSVAVCGTYIAKNVKGKLVYELNNSEAAELKKQDVELVRAHLKDFYVISGDMLRKKELTPVERIKIKGMMTKVRDYCLEYGFYGKALDFARVLYHEFRVSGDETVEKAMKGYIERQIISGDDQYIKFRRAKADALLGKYGRKAMGVNKRSYYNSLPNNVVVPIRSGLKTKEFSIADSKIALSTMGIEQDYMY